MNHMEKAVTKIRTEALSSADDRLYLPTLGDPKGFSWSLTNYWMSRKLPGKKREISEGGRVVLLSVKENVL